MIGDWRRRIERLGWRGRLFALVAVVLPMSLASCSQSERNALSAKIALVRVGIPPGPLVGDNDAGRRDSLFKAGHWTPVLVTIEGKDRIAGAEIVVQSVDSDDTFNEYARPLPVLDFTGEQHSYTATTYARPGRMDAPINVSLRVNGQTVSTLEKPVYSLSPSSYLYATLGARLSGLVLPGREESGSRRAEIGAIDFASELPTRSFGYQTIDLALLITSKNDFMNGLLNDSERRGALVEWVRRGGKLVVAVGKNQSLLQNRPELSDFLPVDFIGTASADVVRITKMTLNDELGDTTKKSPVLLARMKIKEGRGAREIASAQFGEETIPFIVQANYGLGRLTIVGTDPDDPAFTKWKSQPAFWQRLLQDAGPSFTESERNDLGFTLNEDMRQDDLAMQLTRSLETFSSVPVISFGWVALFILIYIIVVGPLDYLFLKKVVKRLELTWVTFPIVVLAVSAGAYFAAYSLKGNDQKINKLDLIDFDLHTKTVQGTTWFSIFSPRVQNYTIGVEPASGWGLAKESASPPTVTWLGRVDVRRQSLFRRTYEYDTNLGGLQRVPIQVWSTKGFQASWYHRIDSSALPLTTNLRLAEGKLTGSITSNLPVPIENGVIFFRGNVYDLGTIFPGRMQVGATMQPFKDWAGYNPAAAAAVVMRRTPYTSQPSAVKPEPSRNIVRSIMFHEAFEIGQSRTTRNAEFRDFDQSWRIQKDDADGAIVYGEVPMKDDGPAEEIMKQAGTVTRLWIGALPGSGAERPPITGTMRQETHLRFFVPVKQ